MSNITTEARNADLPEIASILQDQRARRLDVVTNAAAIRASNGNLTVADTEVSLSAEGVTRAAGKYRPTAVCDEGIASKLGIPPQYLRRMRAERPDLYDANVNGWLHGSDDAPGYDKKLLVRLLKGDPGQPGVARAFLSSRFRVIDNLDVILAVLGGIKQAGVNAKVLPDGCNLSDKRMFVKMGCPEVAALAPKLLDGYRNPFDGPGAAQRVGRMGGQRGIDGWTVPEALAAAARESRAYVPGSEPVVFAGLTVSNSDTGCGRRILAPMILVKVCRNGLTLNVAKDTKVHLGADMPEGIIEWSAETVEQELKLITAQTIDAVTKFLSPDFLNDRVAEVEAMADAPVAKPEAQVREVVQAAGFGKDDADEILSHFIRGGQMTAGGVANAFTSYAQTVQSADVAADLEASAVRAMELVAAKR